MLLFLLILFSKYLLISCMYLSLVVMLLLDLANGSRKDWSWWYVLSSVFNKIFYILCLFLLFVFFYILWRLFLYFVVLERIDVDVVNTAYNDIVNNTMSLYAHFFWSAKNVQGSLINFDVIFCAHNEILNKGNLYIPGI